MADDLVLASGRLAGDGTWERVLERLLTATGAAGPFPFLGIEKVLRQRQLTNPAQGSRKNPAVWAMSSGCKMRRTGTESTTPVWCVRDRLHW
ncbi:hypothetical protein ACFVKB_07645 [Rhodococcus sp. NPDC127530]|uniref:hypothetical protein n=1 Tax=unclassified Rhodococcus (in: high G+C Gram-positive bacteria) TaxID=192944 RepID=UPI003628C600